MTKIHELMETGFGGKPCNNDIYQNGVAVAVLTGASAKLIERFVRELAEYCGEPVDWHYVAGRGIVKTTGDVAKVRDAIETLQINIRLLSD